MGGRYKKYKNDRKREEITGNRKKTGHERRKRTKERAKKTDKKRYTGTRREIEDEQEVGHRGRARDEE